MRIPMPFFYLGNIETLSDVSQGKLPFIIMWIQIWSFSLIIGII